MKSSTKTEEKAERRTSMVKKISIFLLIAFMLLSLSACGPNNRRNLRSEIDALLAEYPEYAEELKL